MRRPSSRHGKRDTEALEAQNALFALTEDDCGNPASQALALHSLKSRDILTLAEAADAAGRIALPGSGARLIELLSHTNELVRVCAADSLAEFPDIDSTVPLVALLTDPSPLVRSHAAVSLGLLGDPVSKAALEASLRSGRSSYAKAGLHFGLYLLGEKEHLLAMARLLQSRQYRVRCFVANSIRDYVADPDLSLVGAALGRALDAETSIAAREAIGRACDRLRNVTSSETESRTGE